MASNFMSQTVRFFILKFTQIISKNLLKGHRQYIILKIDEDIERVSFGR